MLDRLANLENANNARCASPVHNTSRQRSVSPSQNKVVKRKKVHDVSPSPSRNDADEFIYSDSNYDNSDVEDHADKNSADDDFVSLLLEGTDTEKRGPPLKKPGLKMAQAFFDKDFPVESIKPIREKYSEPENCDNLSAKTVNTEMYRLMQSLDRTRDFTLKSIQANTAAAAVANLRLIDSLTSHCQNKALHKDLCTELLTPVSDATKLLAKCYSDLAVMRKSLLSFKVAKPYQSLCKRRTFGKSLFSDDLSKEIKTLDDEAKIFRSFQKSKPPFRGESGESKPKNEYRRGRGQFRPRYDNFRGDQYRNHDQFRNKRKKPYQNQTGSKNQAPAH